ncbi:MAG: hypothetical protein JMDDDDMK_03496 [Acidobacteria bacterium]|nr:hypothetical protein [Acidobacteriota bacterium]
MIAEKSSHATDDARLVAVAHDEHVALRRRFQAVRINRYDALFAATEERARDFALVFFVADDDFDQRGEILRGAGFRFGHAQSALFGDHRGVDLIDAGADLFEQSGQNSLSDRAHVEIGHFAAVTDLNFADRLVEELGLEIAELFTERQIRLHRFERFSGNRRDVDRACDCASQQEVRHRLRDRNGDRFLSLVRRSAQVRRDDHFVERQQRMIRRHRLLLENIERGSRDLARFDRVVERLFVNQTAARAVDDAHAAFHFSEGRLTDDAARFFGQRRVNGDEIRPLEDFVERGKFDARARGDIFGDERIVSDDLHRQPLGARGDDLADVAESDHAQSFSGEFGAHETFLVPFAGFEFRVGLRDFARERHHQ